jgi:hypothetical protein
LRNPRGNPKVSRHATQPMEHKTGSAFDRYNILSTEDVRVAENQSGQGATAR